MNAITSIHRADEKNEQREAPKGRNKPAGEDSAAYGGKERQYWLKKLEGDWVKSNFPFDHREAKNPESGLTMQSVHFELTGEIYQHLKQLSNDSDIRLYIILLTGVVLLMDKYTGNKDIVLGSPIYQQNVEGDFINKILVLRNQVEHQMSFKELLLQVSQTNFEAVENVNYSLETIPYEMDMLFTDDEFPLFDVAVLLDNLHDENYLDHLDLKTVFSFSRKDDRIRMTVRYNSLLYRKQTVKQIMSHYQTLMGQALTSIDTPIDNISLMSEAETKRLLLDFNAESEATSCPRETTVYQLFKDQVDKTPDAPALQHDGERLTYVQLEERAGQLSRRLVADGVKIGSIVAICMDHSIHLVAAILGVLKAGAAYLPIDPDYPQSRVNFILKDSNSQHLIADGKSADSAEFRGTVILPGAPGFFSKHSPEPASNRPAEFAAGPDDLAYVIYTSGTTGNPKGVMVKHVSLLNYVWWAAETYLAGQKLNFPLYSSISFDLTVTSIFTPLITGNEIVVYHSPEKNLLIEKIIEDNQVGVIKLTPSHLYAIKYREIESWDIKCFIVGGELFETRIARDIAQKFGEDVKIYNEYGPTESTVGSLIHRFDPASDHNPGVPVGRPVAQTQVYLLSSRQKPSPPGIAGEIYVSGEGVAIGYLNRPVLTAEKFISNPFIHGKTMYRTGDLARWLPGGEIEFLGRVDHQVKIRGYRIELAEIEHRLALHTDVNEAIVLARNPEEKSRREEKQDYYLCAYFVAQKDLRTAELREYLNLHLPDYMVPSFFVQLSQIPLTSNGKIDRRALPVPEIEKETRYVAPRDDIEKRVVDIWAEVLRLEASVIGIDSSFFELGGQSLKQVYLISQVQKEFSVKVPLSEIFQRQTIRELAEYIREAALDEYIAIEPVEEKEYYPLSSAQKRLYILRRIDLEETVYNVPQLVTLNQEMDRERFEYAFQHLVRRHESIRTSFEMVNRTPVQRIHKEVDFKVEYVEAGKNEPVKAALNKFIRPFDMTQAPLMRVGLLKLETAKYMLMLDIHHIISDGVSMEILSHEFAAIYSGGGVQSLTNLTIQYKDYSEWQNSEPIKEKITQQQTYWLEEFAEEIPVLNLMTDYPRPPVQNFEGSTFDFHFGIEETAGLNQMALDKGVTLYMILLGAFNILLSKLCNQEDIIVGAPVSGRNHADLEPVIGMFVNTLVLRNFPTGDKKVTDFIDEIKSKTLKAFENQEYQFEDLLDRLDFTRDVSRNPLFDVMFAWFDMFRNTNLDDAIGLATGDNSEYFDRNVAKFDMNWAGMEREKQLFFSIEYSIKLFNEETIRKFVGYFKQIVSVMLGSPQLEISQIDILSPEERQQVLFDFNQNSETGAGFSIHQTLHQLVEEQTVRTPDNTSVILDGEELPYHLLNEKANQLAYVLRERGIRPGSIIALSLEPSLELLVGVLGILKSGAAYLPIDPKLPQEKIRYMIKDYNHSLLLTRSTLKEAFTSTGEIICLDDQSLYSGESSNPSPLITPNDLAYVIYTSGSSGKPKGVMIEHRGVVNYLKWARGCYLDDGACHMPLYSSISVDLTVTSIYLPLISGNTVYIYQEKEDRFSISEIVQDNRVKIIKLTPTHLKLIKGLDLSHSLIKRLVVGGEELMSQLAGEIHNQFDGNIEIYNEYGPTETVVGCTIYRYDPVQSQRPSVSIGKPAANTCTYIIDSNQRPQPVGVPGELYIGGVGVARGYLNNPQLTSEKFIPVSGLGYESQELPLLYRSGDLVRWLPDGNIEFLGRIDRQVKVRGFRVELGEIESLLSLHEDVRKVAVLAKSTLSTDASIRNGEIHLYAYLVAEKELSSPQLKTFISKKLPEYLIPSFFIQVDDIPFTHSGKIDRRALEAQGTKLKAGQTFAPPETDIEQRIAAIWSSILPLDQVGVNDNFFDIGGTSLDVLNLNERLNKEFNRDDPVMVLFRYATISAFTEYLSDPLHGSGEFTPGRRKERAVQPDIDQVKKGRASRRDKRRGTVNAAG